MIEYQRPEYQRLVFNGKVIQNGHINTQEKFKQLTAGVDLRNKTVLDIGCRSGAMCYEAILANARHVRGIDIDPHMINNAQKLKKRYYPSAPVVYAPQAAKTISGLYDIVIMSAVFHYIADIEPVLTQVARVTREVFLVDTWVVDKGDEPQQFLVDRFDRQYWVPNIPAVKQILSKHFGHVKNLGETLSPDNSLRIAWQCRKPKPKPLSAIIIGGCGGAGKSTFAGLMSIVDNYRHIPLDQVFFQWYLKNSGNLFSIAYMSELIRGLHSGDIVNERMEILKWILEQCINRDVVIEGVDASFEHSVIASVLYPMGWKHVKYYKMVDGEAKQLDITGDV